MKKILVRGFNCLSSIIPFWNVGISTLLKISSRLLGIKGPVPPPLLMIFIFFLSYLVVYHSIISLSRIFLTYRYQVQNGRFVPGYSEIKNKTLNYLHIFPHLNARSALFTLYTGKVKPLFRQFI